MWFGIESYIITRWSKGKYAEELWEELYNRGFLLQLPSCIISEEIHSDYLFKSQKKTKIEPSKEKSKFDIICQGGI